MAKPAARARLKLNGFDPYLAFLVNKIMQLNILWKLARRVRPPDPADPEAVQIMKMAEVIPLIVTLPTAILALIGLIAATDPGVVTDHAVLLLVLAGFCAMMEYHNFTVQIELASGQMIPISSSLSSILIWSAGLMFGLTGLWLVLAGLLTMQGRNFWRARRLKQNVRWGTGTMIAQALGSSLFGNVIGLVLFRALGGDFPLTGLALADWLPAVIAIAAGELITMVILLPVFITIRDLNHMTDQGAKQAGDSAARLLPWWSIITIYALITSIPFGMLGALIYSAADTGLFVLFALGIVLVNYLAHHLSRTNERSHQRARELEKLEALGEALIQARPDLSTLHTVLDEHLKTMFPQDRFEMRLFPPEEVDPPPGLHWQALTLMYPNERLHVDPVLWAALRRSPEPHRYGRSVVPLELDTVYGDALFIKIGADDPGEEGGEKEQILGGICLLRPTTEGKPDASLSALQALASQIGSAYYRAKVNLETLIKHKMTQELELAGRIQASFLPRSVPEIAGWDIAAGLAPARQTSGDFYDFIPLENGQLGVIVADVADKGTGAALYMALSRTLLRTFAMQQPTAPEIALQYANCRILTDAQSDQFVTVFYAVIDPVGGQIIYANAGHNPAFIVHNGSVAELAKTGVPLGMFEELQWQQAAATLDTGAILVMYSDGVSEAQDRANEEYGAERLVAVIRDHAQESAQAIHDAIIASVQAFVGDAPQFDDMTLVVAKRGG
ncbi:MAG: PP2C family protein-serine/threonine phosphatase [Anaerolineae bacterium]|nr:PP2C family protein-serine/threonine phosphatase [Anaerolineae bacterium]